MQLNDLPINKHLLRALSEKNYLNPTPIQAQAIPLILDGIDIIATAQTGTGKTAAFALPILERLFHKQNTAKKGRKIKALIVSPTRELALQIEESFKSYGKYTNLRSAVIFGGTSMEPQKEVLQKGVDVLVATPGRLLDLHKQDCVYLDYVETLVLDEADLMLDMGFIDDVRKVAKLCPKERQTLLFSATMPDKVIELAETLLKDPKTIHVSVPSSTAKTISQQLFYVPKPKKIELCLHLLRNTIKGNILIFRRTKYGVDKLEQTLLRNNYKVNSIHGAKTQNLRQEALQAFKDREVNILIATDVASRGIDIHDLDAVINFDVPNVPETYIHRIGRTGRSSKAGASYTFCSADEKKYIVDIQQKIKMNLTIEETHPYPLDPKAKPEVHTGNKGSKYKKNRKSEASKKNKKRWY